MSILEYSNHSIKRDNIEYFIQLVRIAIADDIITKNEMELLHKIGTRLGFTDVEVNNLIETTGKSNYIPPYELSKRFEQVYNIVKLVMADGGISKAEILLARGFAVKSNFKESEIPNLLTMLIRGIKDGKDEEELFKVFQKERKVGKVASSAE